VKNKPNLLYLTYDGLTDPLGESQILPYLLGLSNDYDISIVSFEKEGSFKSKQRGIYDLINGRINWIPKPYSKNPPIFSTLYDLFVLRKTCKRLVVEKNIEIVHCRSYLTSLIGLWLKSRHSIKYIFDMRGFWADERIEGNIWNIHNPIYNLIYRYFKKKESQFIMHADHVIVLTAKAKEILATWGRVDNVTVVPCCVDMNLFDPDNVLKTDQDGLREKLGLKSEDFVLCYIGSTGTWYLLDEMFEFFAELNRQCPRAKFLLITRDDRKELIRKAKLKDVNVDNLIIETADRNEIPLFISLTDFTIMFIKNTFSKQGSSPTKLAESLAMGVPSIANTGVGDNEVLFMNNKIGLIINECSGNHYNLLADRVNKFKRDPIAIRGFTIQELSLVGAITQFNLVYKKLLDKG